MVRAVMAITYLLSRTALVGGFSRTASCGLPAARHCRSSSSSSSSSSIMGFGVITLHRRALHHGPLAMVVASDSDSWAGMTLVQLKAVLKERGLRVSGKKAELVERLVEAPTAPTAPSAPPATSSVSASPAPAEEDGAVNPLPPAIAEQIVSRLTQTLALERWRVEGAVKLFGECAFRTTRPVRPRRPPTPTLPQ